MKMLRCAIYTRKSTEEGLEQDFNSLAAQREACAAYVKSQASEGWRLSSKRYDDGGFSGGTMERPALKELLADVDAGVVDVIVVYKVDRLTRALNDFSRIVERLDARGASFVSITQSFNTTTSMGRLTLNVLLSFAQFEREVTSERIRDKIAASKKKGMWMGGRPPLGYAPAGRTLAIEPKEAELVRSIFDRFLVLKSAARLAEELAAKGIASKPHVTKAGRQTGNLRISLGALRHLLANRVYLGEIAHHEHWHPGLHPAIVAPDTFDAAQMLLAAKTASRKPTSKASGAPLRGLVFDDAGHAMSPSFTQKPSGKRHHYYVSQAVMRGYNRQAGARPRVHAGWLEEQVLAIAASVFALEAKWASLRPRLRRIIVASKEICVELDADGVDVALCHARLGERQRLDVDAACARLRSPIDPRFWRGAYHAFDKEGVRGFRGAPDQSLLQAIARAHALRREWIASGGPSFTAIAKREGVDLSYLLRVARLAYLAPEIVRAVAAGATPSALTAERFTRGDLPLDWTAQRRMFLLVDSR